MEYVINNPGLHHLAENIFLNLNYENLEKCQLINHSVSLILDNPMFWIRILIENGLSKENQKEWIKAIQLETNSEKIKYIAAYLKWNCKKKNLFNFQCYTNPDVQEYFRMKIQKILESNYYQVPINENAEILKILAPLTDNPNAPDKEGRTPILNVALVGNTEIVKMLAPLTNNPNAPEKYGITPIFYAARFGFTEIVKIIASLTNNPNATNALFLITEPKVSIFFFKHNKFIYFATYVLDQITTFNTVLNY